MCRAQGCEQPVSGEEEPNYHAIFPTQVCYVWEVEVLEVHSLV